jgi:hypothetical protein
MTCTKQRLSFQNTPNNLHNFELSLYPSTTCDCTIMLTFRMKIHCLLTEMAPKGSSKGKGQARAKMPKSVINRGLLWDRERIKGFISEHIRRLIRKYKVCGVKDESEWDVFDHIIFHDPVKSRHFSQFQLMWPHSRSRSSPFRVWWAAFHSYMGQMFDKTCDQMNNWRWDNPHAFGDQVDPSNQQATSSGKVKRTGECFSWYGSDDLRAKIEPPNCQQ